MINHSLLATSCLSHDKVVYKKELSLYAGFGLAVLHHLN